MRSESWPTGSGTIRDSLGASESCTLDTVRHPSDKFFTDSQDFRFFQTTSIQPFCISSQVCRPQMTALLGSGLRGLSAELSQWPIQASLVPLGISSGFSKR